MKIFFALFVLCLTSQAVAVDVERSTIRWMMKNQIINDNKLSAEEKKMSESFMECTVGAAIDFAFGDKETLDEDVFKTRLAAAMDMDNPDNKKRTFMCMSKDPALVEMLKNSPEEYPYMDLDDLRVDMASLVGKKVRIRGVGMYVMNSFQLRGSETDMSPIFINVSQLSRDGRRQILDRCSDIMHPCRISIKARVENNNVYNGLLADSIEW